MWNRNEKGFSIIEVIIAMGLLSVASTVAVNFLLNSIKSREKRAEQTIYRYLAIQATQTVTTGVSMFPPIEAPGNSQKALYVGCFDGKGEQISNLNKEQEFQFHLAQNFKINDVSGLCDDRTSYEVRFYWSDISKNQVLINIVNLKQPFVQGFEHKNYTIFAK